MKNLSIVFLLLALGGFATSAHPAEPTSHSPAKLRVGLWTLWHDKDLSISPDPGATLRLCATCAASPLKQGIQVHAQGDKVNASGKAGAESLFLDGTVTLVAHMQRLTLHNPLRITARNGELVLAVTLPVETYVERVVASESGLADGPESLKALAIVARSFALHQKHGHTDYDLCDSTHCQLLNLESGIRWQSTSHAATLATAGETLWYHGQRAQAWFHQNCGGKTASPQEVWPGKTPGSKAMPWLASHVDKWCTNVGAHEWWSDISLSDLTGALSYAGLAKPGWKTLTVARRGESGRASMLAAGATQVGAEDFRMAVGRALGWNKLLSTWFEVTQQGDHFVFHGRGAGHGVGLCQVGAAAMGAANRDSTQILAEYFPGATAADEATGRPWQSFTAKGLVLETLDSSDAAFLKDLSAALGEAQTRFGAWGLSQTITVRAFHSTAAFRDATLAPGWVAAFTEGSWIATQPLATLAARKILAPTMRHEFLHALIEKQARPGTPLWFREGLTEALDDKTPSNSPAPALKLEDLDRALNRANTEAESQVAHRAAKWYAGKLLASSGREQVLQWLHNGLPRNALASLR